MARKKIFTEEQIDQIFELRKEGKTQKEIAKEFGVCQETISQYLN